VRRLWLAIPAMLLLLVILIVGLAVVVGGSAAQCGPDYTAYGPAGSTPIPSQLIPIYEQAAAKYNLGPEGWGYLAAINEVETDFGRNMSTSSAGAIGWMQFEPGTWQRYGQAVNHTGPPNPYDPWDAIFAAGDYLSASGAPGDWPAAIYTYNHASWYVDKVTQLAQQYLEASGTTYVSDVTPAPAQTTTGATSPTSTERDPTSCQETTRGSEPVYIAPGAQAVILRDGQAAVPADAPAQVQAAIAAGNQIIDTPYLYGGGHSQPLTTIAASYDCSSAVSFLLHGGGLLSDQPEGSTELESYGDPGPGQWITVYANPTHTFVAIAGVEFDTSASGNPPTWQPPGSGPRWRPNPTGNLHDGLVYAVRHPPGL